VLAGLLHLKLTKRLEELTKDTPAWYAGMRARVEARAALEQAGVLGRLLEELGERLGEEARGEPLARQADAAVFHRVLRGARAVGASARSFSPVPPPDSSPIHPGALT
jgi:hypothetical protein